MSNLPPVKCYMCDSYYCGHANEVNSHNSRMMMQSGSLVGSSLFDFIGVGVSSPTLTIASGTSGQTISSEFDLYRAMSIANSNQPKAQHKSKLLLLRRNK